MRGLWGWFFFFHIATFLFPQDFKWIGYQKLELLWVNADLFYVDKGQKNQKAMKLRGGLVCVDYNHNQGLEFCLMDV